MAGYPSPDFQAQSNKLFSYLDFCDLPTEHQQETAATNTPSPICELRLDLPATDTR